MSDADPRYRQNPTVSGFLARRYKFKQSGWGRENGRDGIDAHTVVNALAIALNPPGDWLAIKG